jgi:hypothetical protein
MGFSGECVVGRVEVELEDRSSTDIWLGSLHRHRSSEQLYSLEAEIGLNELR